MKKKFIFSALFFLIASNASAEVKVLDGDSLIVDKAEIRLIGVDAPEYMQFCFDEKELAYDCGEEARLALEKLVYKKKVVCNKIKKDIYKRDLSECFADKLNINIELLRQGWVVLYRSQNKLYIKAQTEAQKNKSGIWKGRFMKPEFHRLLNRR